MWLKHGIHDRPKWAFRRRHTHGSIGRHLGKGCSRLLRYAVIGRHDIEHARVHPLECSWVNRWSPTGDAAPRARLLHSVT